MKFKIFIVSLVILLASLVGANQSNSQEAIPEQSALLTACQSARGLAQLGNLNMESCRRVSEVIEGNTALVTIRVKISGQGIFFVSVALMKSVWGQQAISVKPA